MADQYSHADLPKLKQSLRGKAFIHLFYCGPTTPLGADGPVEWYRGIMELMAPDVIVVPVFHVSPEDTPEALVRELRRIAAEYARRVNWGWDR